MDQAQAAVTQPDFLLISGLAPSSSTLQATSERSSSTSGFSECSHPGQETDKSDSSPWPTSSNLMTRYLDLDHCCSLLNNIWTPIDDDKNVSNVVKSTTYSNPINSYSLFSGDPSTSYFNIRKTRVIFNVDVESIRPNDVPHHPFDRQFDVTSGNKMFTRKPHGIAINSKTEQIYVADRNYGVVLVLGPDGSYQSQFGGPGSGPGYFNRPTALAFDETTDRLYISDKDNHRVQVFNATSGQFLFTFGSQGSQPGKFRFPWGIAVLNKEGCSCVAVADSRNHRVQFFTKEGLYLDHFVAFSTEDERRQAAGRDGRWKLIKNQPRGLAFDPTGDLLYITDFNHHCIFKLDLARRTLHKFPVKPAATTNNGISTWSSLNSSIFKRPSGIDVDSEGNVFVCDQRNNSIRMFRKDGSEVNQFITGTRFDHPSDLSLFRGLPGYVAVIDLNGRVRVFNFIN